MNDTRIPLSQRSLRFAPGIFQDTARTRDTTTCAREAATARAAAATSSHPLLCLARAAWWAAVAEHCAGTETRDRMLTGTAEAHSRPRR